MPAVSLFHHLLVNNTVLHYQYTIYSKNEALIIFYSVHSFMLAKTPDFTTNPVETSYNQTNKICILELAFSLGSREFVPDGECTRISALQSVRTVL